MSLSCCSMFCPCIFAYCNCCMFWDILRVNLFAAKVCFDEVGIYLGKSSVQSCLLGCGLVISSCNVLISPPPLDSLALPTHGARSFIPTSTDRLLCLGKQATHRKWWYMVIDLRQSLAQRSPKKDDAGPGLTAGCAAWCWCGIVLRKWINRRVNRPQKWWKFYRELIQVKGRTFQVSELSRFIQDGPQS